MYLEDDIQVKARNVNYWLRGRHELANYGLYPSFVRYEINHTNDNWVCVAAPTWRSAFNWFREKYGLAGLIEIGTQEYSFFVFDEKTDSRKVTSSMNGTYEEAELACLDKLIEIVESKQNK
jgi:hypothetical protein